LSTRDLARFGLLFLRNGRWGGQQVVPADWVRESTTPHSVIGPHSGYGCMWWTGEGEGAFPNVDEGPGSYYASGANGQEIIVMPTRNLVVVHLVDSDAGHSVDETSIGTLLWMILDAAGETDIGDPPFLAQATGTRLTSETLPQVQQAGVFKVVSGSEVTVTFGPDKTLSLSVNGTLLAKGTWWLDGDNYCHDLGADFGESECFQVIQNGSRILLFDLDGHAALQLEAASR